MRVKGIAEYPSAEQLERLGPEFVRKRTFEVTVGKEYVVFALSVDTGPAGMGRGAWVDVLQDEEIDILIPTPLCLFDVTDPRVSRHWEMRESPSGLVTFWPSVFYRDFFLDDVSEGGSEALADFRRIRALIESESAENAVHG